MHDPVQAVAGDQGLENLAPRLLPNQGGECRRRHHRVETQSRRGALVPMRGVKGLDGAREFANATALDPERFGAAVAVSDQGAGLCGRRRQCARHSRVLSNLRSMIQRNGSAGADSSRDG
nr:hypothetical protein [Nocardia crassostreae]